ncbi:MAG: preprotein translocase subunit SecE [Bacteroidetes bacterium]|nr:preprotein translocase subunit SecE [Bacteroidota bacterium]MBS1684262.1 preprotein translocase subunit SecE [Bacteroidota bacterium]
MNKIVLYVEEAYDELVHKVSWPTWAELQQSAIVVLVAAVIMALLVLAMDVVSKYGAMGIYNVIHGKS